MEGLQLLHYMAVLPLASARLATTLFIIPFFSRNILTGMTKNSIIMALTLPHIPIILPQIDNYISSFQIYIIIISKEILIGFMIGILVSIAFWAVENAGDAIDMQRGAFFAMMGDPMLLTQSTVFGNLLFHYIVVLFLICGFFFQTLAALYESYATWPIGYSMPVLNGKLITFFGKQIMHLATMTIVMAAPIAIACFSIDFGMGLLNRFAPNLNVFIISLAIKSGTALMILYLYLIILSPFLKKQLLSTSDALQQLKVVLQ